MASDPHATIYELLKELSANKQEALAGGEPTIPWWVWAQLGVSLDEVFGDELSREEAFGELLELTKGKIKMSDWLPPKLKLAFCASFERDARNQQRSRLANYQAAAVNLEASREKTFEGQIKSLEAIKD